MSFLEIKQLTKSYTGRTVVSAIDLSMEEGEILSLLGPSGCGKTTILRCVAGLIKPDSGYIEVGGRIFFDGGRELPVEGRKIGMVFQDFALWPHMTVTQNIAFGLRRTPARAIAGRVAELLTLVNLPGFGDRYPHQLSGGQQQRVAVARALANAPRLILLDEPLSSLDTGLRAAMRDELVDLFRRLKITAINVTHDQDEAMMMSDRIMVLNSGKTQQTGTPPDLYLAPENVFVARFMGAANLLRGRVGGASTTDQGQVIVSDSPEVALTGTLTAHARARLNGVAHLLCRPDDVHVHAEAAPGVSNLIPGTVQNSSFVAGRWRTLVLVAGQTESVLAYLRFPPAVGQSVWLEFPVAHCRVLPD